MPYDFLSFEGGASGLCHASLFYKTQKKHTNLLLNEYEGRTGEYCPEILAVRASQRSVPTKTTEGQYSTVRVEQATVGQ